MDRGIAMTTLILFSALLAFVNASAYSYQTALEVTLAASTPLKVLESLTCFGFTNISVSAIPGEPKCLTPSGSIVYESFEFSLNLSIGTWIIDLGYLYYRAPMDSIVLVVIEKPPRLINATLVMEGREGAISIDLNSSEKIQIAMKASEAIYRLALIVKAYKPGTDIIRIGFYLETS
jgi:hypothetical protein